MSSGRQRIISSTPPPSVPGLQAPPVAPQPSLVPCSRCNGSGSEPPAVTAASEPTGFEPGPGLTLIEARQRMTRAVLMVQLHAAGMAAGPATFGGSEEATQAYAEVSAAARHLVLAQNAWDDYLEARRAERIGP